MVEDYMLWNHDLDDAHIPPLCTTWTKPSESMTKCNIDCALY